MLHSSDSSEDGNITQNGKKALNAPIHIGERAKIENDRQNEQQSIWMKSSNEDAALVCLFCLDAYSH